MVRLAENSIHKNAENELDLADNLTEAALHSSDDKKIRAYAKEAISTLQNTHKDNADQNIKIQSKLIESRAYNSINDKTNAEQALDLAEKRINKNGSIANLRTQLELTKSYLQSGHKEKATTLLAQLADQYKDNPEICAKLDKITDEPVSKIGKLDVIKANKEGIKMFDDGNYLEAVQCFLKATKNFPKHVGLRLNIIQSFIFQIKKASVNLDILEQCEKHLAVVKNIQNDHPQYKRYKSISKTLDLIIKNTKKEN